MRRGSVPSNAMRRLLAFMDARDAAFDARTAERLLDGRLRPHDAAPRFRAVTQAIAALATEATDKELANEAEAVAAINVLIPYQARIAARVHATPSANKRRSTQLAAVTTLGALGLFGDS